MPKPAAPVLDERALNRALLARQHLLERTTAELINAVEQIGGLQAQEPASPYVGLWTRLASLDPADVDAAFRDRRLVKATLMRATLHAVSRRDYRRLQPAIHPMLAGLTRRERGGRPDDLRLEELLDATRAHAATPRVNSELRDHVASLEPDRPPDDVWWWVRRHARLVHAPAGVPWSFGRRPLLVDAEAWLGDPDGDGGFASEGESLVHLVRRHLGAFGPATRADVAAWSGLPVARLRPAIEAIDATGDLRRFTDPRGRELLDLAGTPLPHPDVPAPARLLPMWDSALLAHADRTRIIADADRALVIGVNGDTYPTFLVDGRVGGLWWAVSDAGGRTRIELEPFRALARKDARVLESEAARLAAFLEPIEPNAYARYRGSRDRRRSRRVSH